jgi:hypothetical protein
MNMVAGRYSPVSEKIKQSLPNTSSGNFRFKVEGGGLFATHVQHCRPVVDLVSHSIAVFWHGPTASDNFSALVEELCMCFGLLACSLNFIRQALSIVVEPRSS